MKTKDKISLAFSAILVLCAIIITGFVIRQEFFPPEPQLETQQVKNWQQLDLKGQKTGAEDAPVQIIEFFDYECPYCKSVQPVVQSIQKKYPNQLSIAYEHLPLESHVFASEAAMAAECAGKQAKFIDYHNALFNRQSRFENISYVSLASEIGVKDTDSFTECLETEQTAGIVQSGLNLANSLGIKAIPTFIINGRLVTGALQEDQLDGLVQKALAE